MNRPFILLLAAAQLAAANPDAAVAPVKLSPSLLQVASHLGEGGAHFSVTNVQGDAEKLAAAVDGVLDKMREESAEIPPSLNLEELVQALGIDRVTAYGQSAHQAGDCWHNRMFVATGGHRDGVLSILGGQGESFVAPAYARPDADLVLEVQLNLKQAHDVARAVAQAFGPEPSQGLREAMAEKMLDGALTVGDFLGKFEMRLSLVVTLEPDHRLQINEMLNVPGANVVARLDNAKWVWDSYSEMLADGSEQAKRDGLDIIMVPEPMETPMGPIQPLVAFETTTGAVWAALREKDLQRVRSQGGDRLENSEAFAAATAGLPSQGNALAYSSPRLIKELNTVLGDIQKHAPADVTTGLMLVSAYLPHMAGAARPYAAIIENQEAGILFAMNAPEPVKGRSMMGSTGTMVALSAMATPQIFKALRRAEQAESMNNMKQVLVALHSYAMDHDGKFPPALAELVENGYLTPGSPVLAMNGPDGRQLEWAYVPGLQNVSRPSKILLYSPESIDGKRLVGCVDGSVRAVSEPIFQQLRDEQAPKQDRPLPSP